MGNKHIERIPLHELDSIVRILERKAGSQQPDDEIHFADFVTSTTPQFKTFLRDLNFYIDYKTETFVVDPRHLVTIIRICNVIIDQLDDMANPSTMWDLFRLAGDDDVDYNGTHILLAIDAICEYLEL